jgi:hypothetical protein
MSRLSDEARQERLYKLERLCFLRSKGDVSEDQIAERLDFRNALDTYSAEAMYEQLKTWGLPDWVVKPDDDVAEGTETTKERKASNERKASSGGDVKELPAAEQAEPLFRADLDRLTYYLNEIPDLKEHLQGKLFVSSSWVGEDWEEYYREEYTEHDWKRVCRDFGVDSAQEAFRVPISPYIHRGAGPLPWEGLSILIALHALMNEKVDRLVNALHDDPASVNLEELYERKGRDGGTKDGVVTTLKKSAAQLAEIVRGSEVSRGQKSGKALRLEVHIALAIQELKREGLSAEEIYRQLKERRLVDEEGKVWVEPEHGSVHKEKYTVDDVQRHMKLGLLPPD